MGNDIKTVRINVSDYLAAHLGGEKNQNRRMSLPFNYLETGSQNLRMG